MLNTESASTNIVGTNIAIKKVNIVFLIIMYAMLFIGIRFSPYIAFVSIFLNCLFFIFLPTEYILYDLFFLMPFASIYKYSPGATSFFTVLELFSVLIMFARRGKFDVKFIVGIFVMALYILLTCFISDVFEISTIIKQILNFCLIYFFVLEFNNKMSKNIILFYVCGIIFSSVIALFADFIPNFYEYIRLVDGYLDGETFNRFSGLYGDPNYYSVNLILSCCGILLLYHTGQIKWFFWVGFVCIAGLGFATGSKSFLLMFGCVCIVFLASCLVRRKFVLFILFVLICLAVAALGFSGKITALHNILERLLAAADINSLTTGRFALWKGYFEYLTDNIAALFFGSGVGAPLLNGKGAHNTYLDFLYFYGIIGTIIYFIVLCICFSGKAKTSRKSIFNYMGICVVTVMYFFLGMLLYFDIVFHFMIAWVMYQINVKRQVK